MIRLLDQWFITRHSFDFGLADEPRLKQDFQRPINCSQANPVAILQQVIAYLFNRRMPLRIAQCSPNERALRSLLELLFRQQLLQLFPVYHRGPIIRYSNGL